MNYWIITDTHFGHDNLKQYEARPDEFEWKILKNMNQVLPTDILIHLGDFAIGNDEEWHKHFMDMTQGKKWLVKGNHDGKSNTWYLNHGWDFVGDEIKDKMFGKIILFTHRPIWDRTDFDLNIHGHCHANGHRERPDDERHHLFYIEHEYRPINLKNIVEG